MCSTVQNDMLLYLDQKFRPTSLHHNSRTEQNTCYRIQIKKFDSKFLIITYIYDCFIKNVLKK